MKSISVITNKYQSIVNRIVTNPTSMVTGEYSFSQFKSAVSPIFRQSYLDIVIFDVSAVNEKYLEAIRYLKMNLPSDVRIIVLYPGLESREELQQILVYGIYDIVNTKIDTDAMEDGQIENLIQSELQWTIDEPTTFAKVADKLSISVITENVYITPDSEQTTEEKPERKRKEPKAAPIKEATKKSNQKPRLIGFYSDTNASFSNLISSGKYNIIFIEKATEEAIAMADFSAIDLIVFDNCESDIISYTRSMINVNEINTQIIAGYSSAHSEDIKGVNYFTYDNYDTFARMVAINANKLNKVDFSGNKIFAVYGVKGGVGSTTLTALLAQDYKRLYPTQSVCVVDFGTKTGDIGEKFGIETPNPNIFELVASFAKARLEHLDIDMLKEKTYEYCHVKGGISVIPTSFTDIYKYTDYRVKTSDLAYIYRYILLTLKEQYNAVFIDVTKFGGFTYDIALEEATKLILVSENKLSSVSHLFTAYENIKEMEYLNKTTVVINKSLKAIDENQYELSKIIANRVDENRTIYLPFDEKLDKEPSMMDVETTAKFDKNFEKIWAKLDYVPAKRRKLFGK